MKKIDGVFVPNKSEIERAKATARRISKAHSDESVFCYFNQDTGAFNFYEESAPAETDQKLIYSV